MAAPLTPAPPRRAFEEPGAALDFDKVERNVRSMVAQNAPEADIDGYLASEGLTAEKFAAAMAGKTRTVGDDVKGAGVYVDRLGRKFASGGTFGGAEEISAATNAAITGGTKMAGIPGPGSQAPSFGERYDENVDAERKIDKDFTRENPIAATAAEIGGNIAGTAALLRQFPGLAPLLGGGGISAPMAMRMAKTAAGGMALGGAGGFLSGEGGFVPRVLNAGLGAAFGGAVGAALPPVAAGASAVGRMIAESAPGRFVGEKVVAPVARAVAGMADDATPRVPAGALSAAAPEGGPGVAMDGPAASVSEAARRVAEGATGESVLRRGAVERMVERMVKDGQTPEQIAARLADLGQDAMPFMAAGESGRRLARTAANMPGKGPEIAAAAIKEEARGIGPRVMREVSASVAPDAAYFTAFEKAAAERAKQATAMYKAASDAGLKVSPEMAALAKTPAIREAFAAVKADAERFGQALTDAEIADLVKRTMNAQAQAKMASGVAVNKKMVDNAANAWEAALWAANPKLADASKAYKVNSAVIDALDEGRKFMAGGTGETATAMLPEALAARFKTMGDAEKEAFRVGVASAMRSKVMGGPRSARALNAQIDESGELRAKLTEILGAPNAARIFKMAGMEAERAGAVRRVIGGSDTAWKLADAAEEGIPMMGGGQQSGVVNRMLNAAIDRYKQGARGNEEVRNELARLLFSRDPVENARTLEAIQQIYLQRMGGGAHPAVMGAATQALPSAIGGIIGGR